MSVHEQKILKAASRDTDLSYNLILQHHVGNLEPVLSKEGELFNPAPAPPAFFPSIIPIFHAHWAEIGSEHGHMFASVEFIKAN